MEVSENKGTLSKHLTGQFRLRPTGGALESCTGRSKFIFMPPDLSGFFLQGDINFQAL